MKNILILLSLFYCNSFEFFGSDASKNGFFSSLSFLNIISQTTAQSISREHQNIICQKLKSADYNSDNKIDGADYSLIYLVAMKDQATLENMSTKYELLTLMDLSIDAKERSIASVTNNQLSRLVNEQDVAVLYNYLTNKIPYCPYKNSI